MSHSSPGAGEVPNLQDRLDTETLDFFAVFLAFMARCENLTKSFGGLIGTESYKEKNPYESMLLIQFYQEQAKSKTRYLYSVNKIFIQPGDRSKADKIKDFLDRYEAYEEKYRAVILEEELEISKANAKAWAEAKIKAPSEANATTTEESETIVVRDKVRPYDVARMFCRKELGFMQEDPIKKRAETKQAINFISSLLSDDAFYTSLANASHACVALPVPKDLSKDLIKTAKLSETDDQTASPLSAPFQTLSRTPMMLEKMLELISKDQKAKDTVNALTLQIQPLLNKAHLMALSIKAPIHYNHSFTFNFVRLLNGIQRLEDNKKSDKDAEIMLTLLKLSASLPRIYDNKYFEIEKKPLAKDELVTIAKVAACMKLLQGKNERFPELQETLEEINKLFLKFNARQEVIDFLRESKTAVPSKVEIDPENMAYVLNRYFYMFTPPKPSIPAAEAETVLNYIGEHNPKLTAHTVMVLQNPAKKSVLGAATAAVKHLPSIRRRGSSMADTKAADSPPRVASPESLVAAGFTLDDIFPPKSSQKLDDVVAPKPTKTTVVDDEVSGMGVPPPPPPIPAQKKTGPEIPERSYRNSGRHSLEKTTTVPAPGKPPMPPRPAKTATAATAPVAPKTTVTVPKALPETAKPPAPIVNSKRDTSDDKRVVVGRDGPTEQLAEILRRRREKSDVEPNKGNPPTTTRRPPTSSQ